MAKAKKGISLILVFVLLIAAIATGLVIFITNDRKKSTTAETVMSISVNPSVQFVLNKKNKVMSVKATNEDGDTILYDTEFKGLTAEEAAEKFVTISTESGFIDVNSTTGTTVTVTLSGTKADYTEIQNNIVSKVNTYFDNNGIIAGAVTKINDNLKTALENVYADIENIEGMTKEELLELYTTHVDKTKGVVFNQQKLLNDTYENLKKVLETATSVGTIALTGIKASIATIEASVKTQSTELAEQLAPVFEIAKATSYEELQEALEKAKVSVKNTDISKELKESINNVITSTQKILDEMKEKYETAKKKFEEDYKVAIQDAIDKSNQYLESIKTKVETKLTEGKQKLEERKAYYEDHKQDIQQMINDYRQKIANT